jgi:hypothetical protein
MAEIDGADDAEYAHAAALWNSLTQRERHELLLVAMRLGAMMNAHDAWAGPKP